MRRSVDPTRRLFEVDRTGGLETGASAPSSTTEAFDLAVLATSAQLLGLGEHLLDASVAYVKQRKQFGREIGSYQAIKHRLADVRIALDFARPLVFGAALDEVPASRRPRSPAADAAYLAARTALQVHGADRLHPGVRPQPLDHQGPRAGRPRGARRPSTAPGCLEGLRLMEFALTEEQQELAGTLRALLAKQADSGAVRAAMASEPGTTRRSGRRSASRSAWPRWPSPRSTTASAPP